MYLGKFGCGGVQPPRLLCPRCRDMKMYIGRGGQRTSIREEICLTAGPLLDGSPGDLTVSACRRSITRDFQQNQFDRLGDSPASRRDGRCFAARRSPARSSPVTDYRLARDSRDCHAADARRWCGRRDRGRVRTLPRYRMTKQVEALIAGTYLARHQYPPVCRALAALFKGTIGKDAVSRIWWKVKTDWEAWSKCPLDAEDIVRADPRRHRRARPPR